MSTIGETASVAAERWRLVERQKDANARHLAHIRKQAEESIARIEDENEQLRILDAAFAMDALATHGMGAMTDPDIFCFVHQGMVKPPRGYAPLAEAVRTTLREHVPFFHHAYVDPSRGQGQQDDTLQIRLVIPEDASPALVEEAALMLQPILDVQLVTLSKIKGYGEPSVTVQVDKEYSRGACVVWLENGMISIPQPMGGGEFSELYPALVKARERALERGSSNA